MAETEYRGLRLKAETRDDLQVISSLLQDAVFRIEDMAFQPHRHRFAFVANRFRWEQEVLENKPRKERGTYERVRSALRFEGVLDAKTKGLSLKNKDGFLSLLAIEGKKKGKEFEITLIFSGLAVIRLKVEVLEVYLEDLTGPWSTKNRPDHSVA